MLSNYFKIALRILVKNKVYSIINIVGLATGLSVTVLILTFVMHEYSYDKFHANYKRIYRIIGEVKQDNEQFDLSTLPADFGPSIKVNDAGIKEFVRLVPAYRKVVIKSQDENDKKFYEQNVMFADPSFFRVFSFKLLKGNPVDVLNKPNHMVISERAAKKYFGNTDPIGKALIYDGKHILQIAGITENTPSNSSITFDFIISISSYPDLNGIDKDKWEAAGNFRTFVLLNSKSTSEAIERNINRIKTEKLVGYNNRAFYHLEEFSTLHLGYNASDSENVKFIYVFAGIAALILFLALFNYMSLTTARSTFRAKEIGVRKVIGAARSGLIKQFYIESFTLCLLAFAIALILIYFFRKPFYNALDLQIDTEFFTSTSFICFVASLLLLITLISGSYPALALSSFEPFRY